MTVVLDASAVLALLFGEPGAQEVADAIADGAVIGSVNLSETATILVRHGRNPLSVLAPVVAQVEVESFGEADAYAAAALYPALAAKGLSFGDRACLALALRLNTAAMTADHAWDGLRHGVTVRVIRMAR